MPPQYDMLKITFASSRIKQCYQATDKYLEYQGVKESVKMVLYVVCIMVCRNRRIGILVFMKYLLVFIIRQCTLT